MCSQIVARRSSRKRGSPAAAGSPLLGKSVGMLVSDRYHELRVARYTDSRCMLPQPSTEATVDGGEEDIYCDSCSYSPVR